MIMICIECRMPWASMSKTIRFEWRRSYFLMSLTELRWRRSANHFPSLDQFGKKWMKQEVLGRDSGLVQPAVCQSTFMFANAHKVLRDLWPDERSCFQFGQNCKIPLPMKADVRKLTCWVCPFSIHEWPLNVCVDNFALFWSCPAWGLQPLRPTPSAWWVQPSLFS